MDPKNNKKSLGYVMGQILGGVIVACMASVVVALTIRFLGWILF